MDPAALVAIDIETGGKAVGIFDAAGIPVRGALWLYNSDAEEWRFVVVTQLVDSEGSRAVYGRIGKAIKGSDIESRLALRQIEAVSPRTPFVQALRTAVRTGSGVSGIRFRNNVINGIPIEGAYIYRMQ